MKHFKKAVLGLFLVLGILSSSCSTIDKTMREPNVRVDLTKDDFTLSEQVTADAVSNKIFGIDIIRLFSNKKTGTVERYADEISFASIPVIGSILRDRTANHALYELMSENEGYDVVFYPQYEIKVSRPFLGLGFIFKRTEVTTKARLGKLRQ